MVSAAVSRLNALLPGQQLVEHRAEGEDVRAVIDGEPRTCSGDM